MSPCLQMAAVLIVSLATTPGPAAAPASRTFRFSFGATVTGLKPAQEARVWVPVPPSDGDQDVRLIEKDLPGKARTGRDPVYGNEVLYFEARANDSGDVPLRLVYEVTRREVAAGASEDVKETAEQLGRLFRPDSKVPIDGKPLELLEGKKLPTNDMDLARVLYDVVNGHMRYSKEGTGWGRGDAVWACQSGRGNCSDFHSLFIALARAQKLPAKFEIGFPLPTKRGEGQITGYHCWAKFKPKGKGWVPVDISEANKDPSRRDYFFGRLSPDRIAFSTGRDIDLVPRQDGPPLNFFVYPYVEVGGKPWPDDKVKPRLSYKDQD